MMAASVARVDSDPIADDDVEIDIDTHLDSDAASSSSSSPEAAAAATKQLWATQGIALQLSPAPLPLDDLPMAMANPPADSKDRPIDPDEPPKVVYEGFLRKRYSSSLYMGSWRYCVVHGNRLRWYMTDELAHSKDSHAHLRGEVWIKSVEPWNGHGSVNIYAHAFAIRTTSNRLLLCSAPSQDDKEQWVQCLARCLHSDRQRRLSRRLGRNHDAIAIAHADAAERRRIVPEDAVRAQAAAPSPSPRQHASASFISSVSERESLLSAASVECAKCHVRFGTFLARRVVCHCCHAAFCSRHCSQYAKLPRSAGLRKCCLSCARRQEFLTYLSSVAAFLASLAQQLGSSSTGLLVLAQQQQQKLEDAAVYSRTVLKLRTAPMSLNKTIKILYQTRAKPHVFIVACERLPFYVEHCIDRVESLWYQILHLVQCCDTETGSFSPQLLCLERFIAAICRRSPRIALQTIWHVQAAMEDASRHHPNALLLLLGFLYTGNNSTIWPELLLGECADHQRSAILASLETAHELAQAVVALEPPSVIERWLTATTASEFQACAQELESTGVQLIDYQSSIRYETLQVVDSDLDGVVADQVRFVQSLAAISERLRHVQPVEDRSSRLVGELEELNATLLSSALYPLCTASDQLYKVLRVPPTDGKVFSTKMRAPTLIFIEAVPVDAANLVAGADDRLAAFVSSSRRGNATLIDSISDLIDETAPHARDSLSSSTESSTGTATPHHRRHGSQLSVPDADSLSFLADDAMATPRQQQTQSISSCGEGRGLTQSLPASGFSLHGLTTSMSATMTMHHPHARMDNIVYDSKVYGESWGERRERIRRESPHGHLPGWQLFSIIVKTNDDLRQEVFTMQMLTKLQSIFQYEQLNLWLRTYRIVATGANIGLLETINDACSLDHLKKTFPGGSNLYAYFEATFGEPRTPSFELARRNFIRSMAAYSIVSYVLLVKDRHNGNILLSADGHIIHIDFGFILGIAPGGMFSIEDAPFKLTEEMVEIMGGLHSTGFALFRKLLVDGFLAVQKYQSEIAALLQTTGQHSPFPCFEGAKLARVVSDLRARLCVGLTKRQVEKRVDHLIKKSFNTWGTRQYDAFQLRSNNIQP